jgi:hypothetical protein
LFLLRCFLRLLSTFLKIVDKYRNLLVLLWIASLITLGALVFYVQKQIEHQRLEDRGPCDTCLIWPRMDRHNSINKGLGRRFSDPPTGSSTDSTRDQI